MQPMKQLSRVVEELASSEHYLFTPADLRSVLPQLSPGAFKVLLGRAVAGGLFRRVCRGLYLHPRVPYDNGLLLYHAAARLRAGEFNYVSLETALSDAGVISQIPMQWLTIMSSGRSNRISCGPWGTIEFIHTRKQPGELAGQLVYDSRCHLWRASIPLTLRDMRDARRSLELINWRAVDELV